jgi:uncharacterized protein with HEPN domain
MARNYLLYLKDMQASAQKVQTYTRGLDIKTFQEAEQTIDATLHNLQIIGEAAKNIPEEVRAKYPGIPWRSMARFRDVVAHLCETSREHKFSRCLFLFHPSRNKNASLPK